MDIFFQDPSEIPLPPDEVRIRELRAESWPDGRRVRIYLEFDPFQKSPSAELILTDVDGSQAASASIVESMARKIELTMHLRKPLPNSRLTLTARLFYLPPPPLPAEDGETTTYENIPPKIIDQRQITFTLPALDE